MNRIRTLLVMAAIVAGGVMVGAAPASAGGGGCHGGTFTDVSGTKVDIADACFTPTVLRVQPGQKVTWTNHDGMTHTVTGAVGGWGDYDELTPGKSVSYRFPTAGVFPYFCAFHPGMVAAVVVGDGGSASGTQGAAPVVVPQTPAPPPAAAPATEAVPARPVSTASASVWRVVAITLMVLLVLVAGGMWLQQRFLLRRSRMEAKAG